MSDRVQDLVRVEIATTLFVDPNQADSPEWRDLVRGNQRALGTLANSAAEVTVYLSFDGRTEDTYDAWVSEQNTGNQRARELAEAGEVLNKDMTNLLIDASGLPERTAKRLGSTLRNNGMKDVCSVLTAGRALLEDYSMAGNYGQQSNDAINRALAHVGLSLPEAPTVEDAALLCDGLEQVPGAVLMRFSKEADRKARATRTKPEDSLDSIFMTEQPDTSDGWEFSGVLKRSIGELSSMSLQGLTAVFAAKPFHYPKGDPRNLEVAQKQAQNLRRIVQEYGAKFTAAKERRNT